jgi:hypothetical protein
MKIKKSLLIVFMVLVSLFAIGAVSASDSDNATDIMEISDVNEEIGTIDADEIGTKDIDENQDADELLSDGETTDDVQINVSVKDTSYDERVSINVTVVDNTGTVNFTNSQVEIYANDKYLANAPISAQGQSGMSLALEELDVGTYCIKATLINGTDRIATNSTVFSVTKATPIVNVEDIAFDVYRNVTIPVTVTDKNGKGVTGGAVVTIFWSGDSISKYVNVVDGNGAATFNFADVIGVITSMSMEEMMSAMMGDSGDDIDWEEMFSGNFNWSQMGNMDWSSMFNGSGSGGMDWASMFSGNSSGNMMEDMMGSMMTVSFEYVFTPGKYNVTTTFLPTRNYERANATSLLTVMYLEDVAYLADIKTPKKFGGKTTVKIAVMDKYSNPIGNINVSVILDGKENSILTLDENGTAKITFENLAKGNHELILKSTINGSSTNQTFEFEVNNAKGDVTITAADISVSTVNVNVDGKAGEYFTATLKDSLGNVLANKDAQISIDNQKYVVTTDKNGVVKLQINIAKAGTYTCTVAFLSDDTYNGAFNIAKVTVKKQTAKLTTAKKTYKAKAKTKKLTATFKSSKGKALKGKKITFTVKGKTYKATTNAKGVATVKVKLTKKGKYTFTAKFAGDDTYNAISKKAKLILK